MASGSRRSHLANRTPFRYTEAQVIGVAHDVSLGFLEDENPSEAGRGNHLTSHSRTLIYFPTDPRATGMVLLVRVNGDPEAARQSIDKTLASAAPGSVDRIHKMQELVAGRVYPFRMAYWISALLGTLAQRRREMGIRMALGASAGSMVVMVLRQSLRLAAVGILIGGAMALGVSRLLASVMVLLNSFDWTAFAGGITMVVVACLAAAFFPSLRAARVDPVGTLRHD
jgi:predicted lysophospholipase L1 biosynthesis ABC-type transport system permease subunit